ncbi:hypothetical protein [Malonomonas rubra]|uniref:hypothetical protein n=1 Tax=Malonomonas rubra TaxID=57040 RepID=UPI0026EC175B|nr:hypothetical protein [Malonomonas rubra]
MLRKIIIFCLLTAILLPLILLKLALAPSPLVTQSRTPDSAAAQQTKLLLKDSWKVLKQDRQAELTVRIEELNAAAAFVGRGAAFLAGQFALENQTLHSNVSLKIPSTPFGEYLNLGVTILPSEQGLKLASCSIGQLKIPGSVALWSAETVLNLLGDEQLGSRLLATVENLTFGDDRLHVTFRSGAEFGRLKNRLLAVLKGFLRQQSSDYELQRTGYYLQLLDKLNRQPTKLQPSLGQIIPPLFRKVEKESQNRSPQEENRAALTALSIYLGGWEFHRLSRYLLNPPTPFPRNSKSRFLLAGRNDLRQHFLVSAGIKLLSDVRIGFAVGEFKELLDANPGGSGFSFIDLAADRSGLWFAERATASEQGARKFQRQLVSLTGEREFFPDFRDLEEGLSEKNFIDRYGNIDSIRYQEVVELIDQRLSQLSLYQ